MILASVEKSTRLCRDDAAAAATTHAMFVRNFGNLRLPQLTQVEERGLNTNPAETAGFMREGEGVERVRRSTWV